MSGLTHDFCLILQSQDSDYNDIKRIAYEKGQYVGLHDDIVEYFWDYLKWIPTFNPSTNESGFGLNHWGVTQIRKEGAQQACDIFCSLAGIFALGPERLDLRGAFSWSGDDVNNGSYETIQVNRDELTKQLGILARFCELVLNAECILVHYGI